MLHSLSHHWKKRVQFLQRRRSNRGYALLSVMVLTLILAASSTAMMVRIAGERTASGQNTQIILARNNAENGMTEIVRQLNGPYSYLTGMNKFDAYGNNQWKNIAETVNQQRADYYQSIRDQLGRIQEETKNRGIRVGCEVDSEGKTRPYTQDEISNLHITIDALHKQYENEAKNLPPWINFPTKQTDNLTNSNSPWIYSGSTPSTERKNTSRLLAYQILPSDPQNQLPTQATVQTEGIVGLGGNGKTVISQGFNLQSTQVDESALFPYTGLLFKSVNSDIGSLDIEPEGQIARDPVSNEDIMVYNFCLANVTCIDCKNLDPKSSDGLKRSDDRNNIAGILNALDNQYDFQREMIDKLIHDNPAKPIPAFSDFPQLSDVNSNSQMPDLLRGVSTVNLDVVTLNPVIAQTGVPAIISQPELEFFNVRSLVSTDTPNTGQVTADTSSSLLKSADRAEAEVNSVVNVNSIRVEGHNRAVIRIDAKSIMTDKGRIRSKEFIQRPDKSTPLPIVIIEGPITLEISGNNALGDAFIIAPEATVIVKGDSNDSARLLTGSMWVSSFEIQANTGEDNRKAFLDGQAEVVVDPDMPRILKQLGLTELAIDRGTNGSYQSYRLVPGSASSWTINTTR